MDFGETNIARSDVSDEVMFVFGGGGERPEASLADVNAAPRLPGVVAAVGGVP